MKHVVIFWGRPQWHFGLRRGSAAARLLGLRVLIPQGHECLSLASVVLLGRGLYMGLITHPEGSYRVRCPMTVIAKPCKGSP